MNDILYALALLALLVGLGALVLWDVDRVIDRLEREANTIRELRELDNDSTLEQAA